jgi:hypothetical protein
MSYFFRFESDQERSLAYIPMLVRMKLDTSGVKLTLAQWNRLPEPDRRRLFESPCDDKDQASNDRELLCRLVLQYTGEPARLLQLPNAAAWNNVNAVPAQLVRRARDLGLTAPSLDQWRGLTAAQRFALLKLTRDGHESPNYLPALQEFALI